LHQSITSLAGTSPAMGQPKLQESEALMSTPAAWPARATRVSAASDCSRVMRRLHRLWLSLADITRLSSSARDSMARSAPRTLGTRAL